VGLLAKPDNILFEVYLLTTTLNSARLNRDCRRPLGLKDECNLCDSLLGVGKGARGRWQDENLCVYRN
jgi:hypothetical protein